MADTTSITPYDKWCRLCQGRHDRRMFATDRSRADRLASACREATNLRARDAYTPKGSPTHSGPPPHPPRDGDKQQARQRINILVRTGRLAHPNMLPCCDCGHIWSTGERRHEYDHHRGYAAAYHYDVEPVCTTCHVKRDSLKIQQTQCVRGHPYTAINTGRKTNGTRFCKTCIRAYDKKRRTAEYWHNWRQRKKEQHCGR